MALSMAVSCVPGRRLGALVLGLVGIFAGAQALQAAPTPGQAAADRDPLHRLAASLQTEPEYVHADFAAIAIGELLTAYEREFGRLGGTLKLSAREQSRQARWAVALRAFLDALYDVRDALDGGARVQILVAPPAPVQLLVGEVVVLLASPRIDGPGEMDQAIVRAYCNGFGCAESVLRPRAAAPLATLAPVRGGAWSFESALGSIYETVDGLGFMFSDVRARSAKEQVCRRVREELLRVAEALLAQQRAGRAVDFASLRLEQAGPPDQQYLVLTAHGDRLRLSLPVLARAPGVVEIARGWLHAQVHGHGYRQLFPRADVLLASLLAPS